MDLGNVCSYVSIEEIEKEKFDGLLAKRQRQIGQYILVKNYAIRAYV